MCLSFKEPIRDSTRAYVDHVPKRVARRGTSVMGVFWLKITYTFLTDRNAFFFFTFFTGQTTNILPTMSSFLLLVSTQETRKTISLISQGMEFLGLKLYPQNEATTSTFYWTNESPSRPWLGTNSDTVIVADMGRHLCLPLVCEQPEETGFIVKILKTYCKCNEINLSRTK